MASRPAAGLSIDTTFACFLPFKAREEVFFRTAVVVALIGTSTSIAEIDFSLMTLSESRLCSKVSIVMETAGTETLPRLP